MSKWNVRLNKSGERWFGSFVHSESSARKGMEMPIKEKPVHIRVVQVSGVPRFLGSIRHSIPRSNLEWACDLEAKARRRILNPFAPAYVTYASNIRLCAKNPSVAKVVLPLCLAKCIRVCIYSVVVDRINRGESSVIWKLSKQPVKSTGCKIRVDICVCV